MLYFIPELRDFAEVKIFPADVKKDLLKATLKEIKNIINNQTFIMDETEKVDLVNSCMDVYKEKFNLIVVLTS